MAYTAEEFETVLKRWDGDDVRRIDDPVIEAALRIASAVMRPGVIEAVLGDLDATTEGEAAAIRSALTDAKP